MSFWGVSFKQTYEEDGRQIQKTLSAHPGNDVTGMVARSEKVAGSSEQVSLMKANCFCFFLQFQKFALIMH